MGEKRRGDAEKKYLTIWSLFITSFLRKHNGTGKLLLKKVSLKIRFQMNVWQ